MAIRHKLLHGYRPQLDHKQHAHAIAALTTKVANTMYHAIQVHTLLQLHIFLWQLQYVIALISLFVVSLFYKQDYFRSFG